MESSKHALFTKADRGSSRFGRGQWACTLKRSADLMSTAANEEKPKALPSTPHVGVTLYSHGRSLGGSLLDLQRATPFARCLNQSGKDMP